MISYFHLIISFNPILKAFLSEIYVLCLGTLKHMFIIWINPLHSSNSYFIVSVSALSYPSQQEPSVVFICKMIF